MCNIRPCKCFRHHCVHLMSNSTCQPRQLASSNVIQVQKIGPINAARWLTSRVVPQLVCLIWCGRYCVLKADRNHNINHTQFLQQFCISIACNIFMWLYMYCTIGLADPPLADSTCCLAFGTASSRRISMATYNSLLLDIKVEVSTQEFLRICRHCLFCTGGIVWFTIRCSPCTCGVEDDSMTQDRLCHFTPDCAAWCAITTVPVTVWNVYFGDRC